MLVEVSYLCPQQESKHSIPQSTCWQTLQCYCGVKDNTSVLLCPRSPPVFRQPWVLGGWKAPTASCQWLVVTISVYWEAPNWWLRGARCHDLLPALKPLGNNGASLLALRIYAVIGLWQGWCVCAAYGFQWQRKVIGCLLPLLHLRWKNKTPVLFNKVERRKEGDGARVCDGLITLCRASTSSVSSQHKGLTTVTRCVIQHFASFSPATPPHWCTFSPAE